ncbi:MAG: hypothetical protein LKF74_02055 [Megasphaera sp.]|jgi:hypothetical protein|nr:hypothetical protein [Megasphaera sp.]MCH4187409.1 hypothetical protein [Megasphaera sp.]MCH4217328.1 hypothetical protein [Megasphaera sp.]
MKIKEIILLATAVLTVGMTGSFAKEKGTLVSFPHWGVITVPDDLYMEAGSQPMLTADAYGNDVVAMVENIYPVQPATYQIVQKDDAALQYGYLLHYTVSRGELEAAVEQSNDKQSAYLRDIGIKSDKRTKSDNNTLMKKANDQLVQKLPADFRLTQAIIPKKINGKWFYEGTIERTMRINQNWFNESMNIIAYPHGNTVEIAVVFANRAEQHDLTTTVASMLENAQKMPKK